MSTGYALTEGQQKMPQRHRTRRGFAHESTRNETVEWYTPPRIFEALGLQFDLDPASPGAAVVPWIPARIHYTILDDGLSSPWFGRVWLNPPYGRATGRWLARLARHGNGIALVFARTGTRWFQTVGCHAALMCFIAGRVRFVRSDGQRGNTAGADSMLFAFGDDCARALKASGLGLCAQEPRP